MKKILFVAVMVMCAAIGVTMPLSAQEEQGIEVIENPDVPENQGSPINNDQGQQGDESKEVTDENVNEILSQIKSAPQEDISGGVTVLPDQGQGVAPAQYAAGQIIVKLKDGNTLSDIAELNSKYGVTSTSRVFEATGEQAPHTQEGNMTNATEAEAGEGAGHDRWYWQMEKDSQEYKDYSAKLENDKQGFLDRLALKEGKTAEEAAQVNLDTVYLLKLTSNVSIPEIVQEYASHPAVEYAEQNFMATPARPESVPE